MFSCCFVFSCCCCFCFSLSVLNLFPGLESSPSSPPAGFWKVLMGPLERVPCPHWGACPRAAGVTGRRPEGAEPARGPAGWRERWALPPRFLATLGIKIKTLQKLRSQVPDQVHPGHEKESSWTAASCTASLQGSPQLPTR